jgi:hypothetical protein
MPTFVEIATEEGVTCPGCLEEVLYARAYWHGDDFPSPDEQCPKRLVDDFAWALRHQVKECPNGGVERNDQVE